MSKKCDLLGKSAQFGHRVSHAKNRTKHVFKPNLQNKRVFIPSAQKTVRMSLSTHAMRIIDKMGVEQAFAKYNPELMKTILK